MVLEVTVLQLLRAQLLRTGLQLIFAPAKHSRGLIRRFVESHFLKLSPLATVLRAQIIEKFRWCVAARRHQIIASAGAGNVQQMTFRVVDLPQVRIIADCLDSLLQEGSYHHRNLFYHHSTKL